MERWIRNVFFSQRLAAFLSSKEVSQSKFILKRGLGWRHTKEFMNARRDVSSHNVCIYLVFPTVFSGQTCFVRGRGITQTPEKIYQIKKQDSSTFLRARTALSNHLQLSGGKLSCLQSYKLQ